MPPLPWPTRLDQHVALKGIPLDTTSRYAFPLAIQLGLKDDLHDPSFRHILETLQEYGFYGVELNVTDFKRYPASAYVELLAKYGLKLTMIATGAYAKKNNLSLSSPDAGVRRQTLNRLLDIVKFAAEAGCGVICGFIKGPAGMERESALANIRDSLNQLNHPVREAETPLLLEATNHYETTVAVSVPETVSLIEGLGNRFLRVLPDTYHLHIEEADTVYSLLAARGYYDSFHISDNNRFFPGYGAIDFFKIFAALKGMDYRGIMAIEGNWRGTPEEDIALTCKYLLGVSRRIALLPPVARAKL